MRIVSSGLAGTYLIEQDRRVDERGFFARTWCADELTSSGLDARIAQVSTSFNARRGTLRGLHYQVPPHAEVKVIRCTRGAIFDVAVDLRPDSPAFGRWIGLELTADNGRAHYVPRGFAHGFLTLADESEIEYQISTPYAAAAARGLRWNDPFCAVRWPAPVQVISDRDREYTDVDLAALEVLRGL